MFESGTSSNAELIIMFRMQCLNVKGFYSYALDKIWMKKEEMRRRLLHMKEPRLESSLCGSATNV